MARPLPQAILPSSYTYTYLLNFILSQRFLISPAYSIFTMKHVHQGKKKGIQERKLWNEEKGRGKLEKKNESGKSHYPAADYCMSCGRLENDAGQALTHGSFTKMVLPWCPTTLTSRYLFYSAAHFNDFMSLLDASYVVPFAASHGLVSIC